MSTETTTVETVDMDIEQLLNGAENVMVPATPAKPSIFSKKDTDLSFLNKPLEDEEEEEKVIETNADGTPKVKVEAPANPAKPNATQEEIDQIINLNTEEDDDDTKKNSGGRPKMDKAGLVELATKLIEKKMLVPFDDDKPLDKYTLQDFEELFEANEHEKKRALSEETAKNFWTSLPEELQFAGKYLADGGTDLKGLFRTLGQVEEVRELDPTKETDQKQIVRSYLQATNFGTPDEIEEEINSWDDHGELEAKASKFKPKLDALSEKQVQYKIKQQEQLREQYSQQAEIYMDSVYKTLEPAELNGLKLDKKTQNLLFSGLVQPNYASVSGKPTNLLGHLLEQHQYVKPNHALVAEALWLLADPDSYRAEVRKISKKEVVTDTVRKLKTEERNKIASHAEDDEANNGRGAGKKPGLQRPSQGFFKR